MFTSADEPACLMFSRTWPCAAERLLSPLMYMMSTHSTVGVGDFGSLVRVSAWPVLHSRSVMRSEQPIFIQGVGCLMVPFSKSKKIGMFDKILY